MVVTRLEVLVEEGSMRQALDHLLPKIVPGTPYEIRVFNGKPDLLKKLPDRLRGYASLPALAQTAIVVVVDRDRDDCVELKAKLDLIATDAGLAEALEQVLRRAGHHRGGLRKQAAADDIARHFDVDNNRSVSFQKFRDGVRLLIRGTCHAEA